MLINSNLRTHVYDTRDAIKVFIPKQRDFYLFNNVMPVDIFPSEDIRTGKKILVYVFLKKDTEELYQRWINYDTEIE